jgi:hypothetical protein
MTEIMTSDLLLWLVIVGNMLATLLLTGWAVRTTDRQYLEVERLRRSNDRSDRSIWSELQLLRRKLFDQGRILEAVVLATGPIHRTNEGRVLRLADMTQTHLLNAWVCSENTDNREDLEDELLKRVRDVLEKTGYSPDSRTEEMLTELARLAFAERDEQKKRRAAVDARKEAERGV